MLKRSIKLVAGMALFKLLLKFSSRPGSSIRSSNSFAFLLLLLAGLFSNVALSHPADSASSPAIFQQSVKGSHQSNVPPAKITSVAAAREIVFIDSAVSDQSLFLNSLQRNAEVVLLPADEDGLTYISNTLKDRSDIDAIHIVSHGDVGQLRLGSAKVNSDSLAGYQPELRTIQHALTDSADILLYGCNVSQGDVGHNFLSAFAESTNANIAASTNVTGSAKRGGDWILESNVGEVRTATVFNNQLTKNYTEILGVGIASISGVEAQGSTLTASVFDDDGTTLSAFGYQWLRNGAAIGGANAQIYTLIQADVNTQISVAISYSDDLGNVENISSATTGVIANINDALTGSLSIAGNATEGQTLTASNTIADADVVGVFSYQWKRGGLNVGINSASYLLTQSDVGSTLTVTVSYTDGGGTFESLTSAATATVIDSNVAPAGSVFISGTATEGQTLAATNTITDANGLGVLSYQWKRGSVNVGINSNSYLLTQPDVGNTLTVTVSYTDGAGTFESLTSLPTATVIDSNVAPAGSVFISGTATEGQTLAATNTITDANGLGVLSYQWKRGGLSVGVNSNSYLLTQSDVGKTITVTVSYTDGAGTLEKVDSVPTAPIINVSYAPTGSVVISGNATDGQTLTATDTIADADGLNVFSYQWQRGGVNVGGNSNTYLLTQPDVGSTLTVTVSYTDGGGALESMTSAATAVVINTNDAPVGALTIVGSVIQNQILTADASAISDADGPVNLVFNYQWLRNGVIIIGATSRQYTLTQTDVGQVISVWVTYADAGNTAEKVVSVQTVAVANVNDAPVGVLTISGSAVQNQVLTVDASGISDADGLGAFSYQWLRGGEFIVGATANTYTLGQVDVGGSISAVVSYTDGGGVIENVTSGAKGPVVNVNDPGVVTIDGGATDGSLITIADITDADGTDGSNFSYQWLRDGVNITGETGDSYTIVEDDIGKFISLVVSYTDDQGTAESVFSNRVGAIRPDVPTVTAPPEVGPVNATGWFTFVTLDPDSVATAFDTLDNSSITPVPDSNGQFRPGETTVVWSATDAAGNVGTATQIIKVRPLAEISKIQRASEGSSSAIRISLNGEALAYPVTVPYSVSNSDLGTGTANSADHSLVSSTAVINKPVSGELPGVVISFSVIDDGLEEGVESMIVTLAGAPVNAVLGPDTEHTIQIIEGNVAPTVRLEATQLQIDSNSDRVTVFAIVTDANDEGANSFTYNWKGTDDAIPNANGATDGMFSFDPSGIAPGFYKLHVAVSDGLEIVTSTLMLSVLPELEALSAEGDIDGDGIDDQSEGFSDGDGDSIADYLDAIAAASVIQILPGISDEFIMQTEPGLKLSLGEIAFKAGHGSSLVEQEDVTNPEIVDNAEADTIENVGGYFDFTVTGLSTPGQVVNVIIPLLSEMPRAPVYRKLTASGWQDYVEDSKNTIASAAGSKGYCPPPGDSAYQAGLKQGHWCLQLMIEDGGPNDSDGQVNYSITDPGGLGRTLSSVNVSSAGGGGGSFNPIVALFSLYVLLTLRSYKRTKR